MKLIQTPSLITGVILGASLITLSAAGSNAAPEDLNVFVPGTAVSSADVNDNFTYLDDVVTSLEGRVEDIENTTPSAPKNVSGSIEANVDLEVAYQVPLGKTLLVTNISAGVYASASASAIMRNPANGDVELICQLFDDNYDSHYQTSSWTSPSGYVIPEGCSFEIRTAQMSASWTGILIDAQ